MALVVIHGPTIAAGESLSDAVNVSDGTLVRLTMPAEWTDADLTFQISTDGVEYNDMYDHHGAEVTCVCTPGVGIIFPRDFLAGIGFIKFRSGHADHPRPQPEQRLFAVAVLLASAPAQSGEDDEQNMPVQQPVRA